MDRSTLIVGLVVSAVVLGVVLYSRSSAAAPSPGSSSSGDAPGMDGNAGALPTSTPVYLPDLTSISSVVADVGDVGDDIVSTIVNDAGWTSTDPVSP